MPEGSNAKFENLFTNTLSGTPYCKARLIAVANASIVPDNVEPSFATRIKISPGDPSSYKPTVKYPFASPTLKRWVIDLRFVRQFKAVRCRHYSSSLMIAWSCVTERTSSASCLVNASFSACFRQPPGCRRMNRLIWFACVHFAPHVSHVIRIGSSFIVVSNLP